VQADPTHPDAVSSGAQAGLEGEEGLPPPVAERPGRDALVFSGGGARGAYEAGVACALLDHAWPRLGPGYEAGLVSGTSVGAIHAAYLAASADQPLARRSRLLRETWLDMRMDRVLKLSGSDLLALPLRALGLAPVRQRIGAGARVTGGLVDIEPLEAIVRDRIPWAGLRGNLERGRPGALCVSCTEVRTGRVTVFLDGPFADATPWAYAPSDHAEHVEIDMGHVRASAAIPFLFPAVRLGDRYYVDGGLRMNTPLSPALRLGGDRVVVVTTKHTRQPQEPVPAYPEDVVSRPAFLLGKVLDALTLDPIDSELHHVQVLNAVIDRGAEVCGPDFLARINQAVRRHRGTGYRHVSTVTVRPSEDLGRLAAECVSRGEAGSRLGPVARLLTHLARAGTPEGEADLLSYLFFDRAYTGRILELGYEDGRRAVDDVCEMFSRPREITRPPTPAPR